MKLKKTIIQITASLLLSCGFVRAAETFDVNLVDAGQVHEFTKTMQAPPSCSLPCSPGEQR